MQRGRKSPASVVLPLAVDGRPPPLDPPSSLTNEERKLFIKLIASCDTRHFVESDLPLLVSFIQSTILSRKAYHKMPADPDMVAVWEKATRMQATLATRLRLAPQARVSPTTLARRQEARSQHPNPWDN